MHARAQNFAKSADSLRMFYEFLQISRRGVGAAISAAASLASTQSFSETEPETPEHGLA